VKWLDSMDALLLGLLPLLQLLLLPLPLPLLDGCCSAARAQITPGSGRALCFSRMHVAEAQVGGLMGRGVGGSPAGGVKGEARGCWMCLAPGNVSNLCIIRRIS
jgi:hypothetical protein